MLDLKNKCYTCLEYENSLIPLNSPADFSVEETDLCASFSLCISINVSF